MNEIKEFSTLHQDGSTGVLKIEISTQPTCRIVLIEEDESVVYASEDLFSALAKLRLDFEKRRIFIACNGARKDVFPSGMAREMSRGRKAYVLKFGQHPNRADVVDIFDVAPAQALGSVKDQQEYFAAWQKSL